MVYALLIVFGILIGLFLFFILKRAEKAEMQEVGANANPQERKLDPENGRQKEPTPCFEVVGDLHEVFAKNYFHFLKMVVSAYDMKAGKRAVLLEIDTFFLFMLIHLMLANHHEESTKNNLIWYFTDRLAQKHKKVIDDPKAFEDFLRARIGDYAGIRNSNPDNPIPSLIGGFFIHFQYAADTGKASINHPLILTGIVEDFKMKITIKESFGQRGGFSVGEFLFRASVLFEKVKDLSIADPKIVQELVGLREAT